MSNKEIPMFPLPASVLSYMAVIMMMKFILKSSVIKLIHQGLCYIQVLVVISKPNLAMDVFLSKFIIEEEPSLLVVT